MDNKMLIWLYCGLNWAQFSDLDQAYHGTLAVMNGARRQAMQPLIGKDLRASNLGIQIWQRGQMVMSGDFDQCPDTFAKIADTAKAARLANKHMAVDGFKFCSADMKVLRALGEHPGTSWNFLTSVYGYRTIQGLVTAGLINPHNFDARYPKWGWYTLTCDAIHLLEDLDGQA